MSIDPLTKLYAITVIGFRLDGLRTKPAPEKVLLVCKISLMYFSVFPHKVSLSGQFDFLEKGFVMIKLAIISDKRNTQVTRRSASEGVFSHLTVCLSFI